VRTPSRAFAEIAADVTLPRRDDFPPYDRPSAGAARHLETLAAGVHELADKPHLAGT